MTDYDLLVSLHLPAERQGPGGDSETIRAMELAGLDRSRPLNITDIGCGTGASSLLLAKELDAKITSVDFLPEFLKELRSRAERLEVSDRIATLERSMDSLPFGDQEFDVIWSEGAVYNMGFEAGISYWRRFLKPGGKLVLSEITWLTSKRPSEIQSHWEGEYPEIDVPSSKMAALERNEYSPEGYFVLPSRCWLDNYYRPMEARFAPFLECHDCDQARAIVEAERDEIDLYERYHEYYSYGFYVASKI